MFQSKNIRSNIISWLPIKKKDVVLQIGEDSTEITQMLSEMSDSVFTIRTWDEMATLGTEKFDYVILIGTLEKARTFVDEHQAQYIILKTAYERLKENGQMIFAIDNCFGLRFWSGSKEENSQKYFYSIENNTLQRGEGLLSATQIENLLKKVGCREWKCYYPYPDYKITRCIYSDDFLPKKGELSYNFHNFEGLRLNLLDEEKVFDHLIEQNKFSEFANSYLYIVR